MAAPTTEFVDKVVAMLWTPYTIPRPPEKKQFTLKNKIVYPPMAQRRSLELKASVEYYKERAIGGPGLMIVEATQASSLLDGSITKQGLQRIADAIHSGGAVAAIQLFFDFCSNPNELSEEALTSAISQFAKVAKMAEEAGFDGVEPHGAHGFVLQQFTDPSINNRKDKYGMRNAVPLAIVRAIKEVCTKDLLLLYRITPIGQGFGVSESVDLAKQLVAAGVEILDVSSGVDTTIKPASKKSVLPPAGDDCIPFKGLGVTVIAVGEMCSFERSHEVLSKNKADLIAVGRQLITDPHWPIKVRDKDWSNIKHCVHCNVKCFGNFFANKPVECVKW